MLKDSLWDEQEALIAEAEFYLKAFQADDPIREKVPKEMPVNEFIEGESLIAIGTTDKTENGEWYFEQYWSSGKVVRYTGSHLKHPKTELWIQDDRENSPSVKLIIAITALEKALRIQKEIDRSTK